MAKFFKSFTKFMSSKGKEGKYESSKKKDPPFYMLHGEVHLSSILAANFIYQLYYGVLLGLLNVWNVSFLGYLARAILPYSQDLEKFTPRIQQVSMESNGKGVSIDGVPLPYEADEIDFGEPGTNGQHNFYQLIHQGRVIPSDFIGIVKSRQPVYLKGEVVSNHDELMSNFFAQLDALAYGKVVFCFLRYQLFVIIVTTNAI
ncbi:glucose-6-phosphate isomerase, cytosolic 2B-like [Hibiscus syriacus]|uniref:glucose-6-phosphate isomerase, cytosolic 2B-like n=1 Tax=Hibiscus syriacus TaxID=106335 RepID=UPI00192313CA|nr:glucose-6-phosphate isomerase, cytosolic 2B-like [Hibiscus syriacus]